MSQSNEPVRGVWSCCGQAFRLMRMTLPTLLPILIIASLPDILSLAAPTPQPSENEVTSTSPVSLIFSLIGSITLSWASVAALYANDRQLTGRPVGAGDCARVGFKRLLPFLAATVLSGLVIFVGYLALIVPGIYLSVRLFMAGVPIATAGDGPLTGMRKSWHVVKGHWWRAAGVLSVLGLVTIALYLGFIGAFAMFIYANASPNGNISLPWIADVIVAIIFSIIGMGLLAYGMALSCLVYRWFNADRAGTSTLAATHDEQTFSA